MIINVTKKLQDFLKIKDLEQSEESGFDIWYGNIFMVGRKKGLLLTHSETFFSIFIYGVTQATVKNLESIVRNHLYNILVAEKFSEGNINKMLTSISDIRFMKYTNRSVSANMTQQAFVINSYHINDGDDLLMSQKINRMPVKSLDYKYPIEVLKKYLANPSKTKHIKQTNKEVLFIKLECINIFFEHSSYKKVEMIADTNLSKLCKEILKIYKFDNDHLHKFYLSKNGDPYRRDNIFLVEQDDFEFDLDKQNSQEKKIILKDTLALKPEFFLCMQFDFGDDWVFKISPYKKQVSFDPKKKYPFIVKEIGENPEQYPNFDEDYDDGDVQDILDNFIKFDKL